MFLIPAAQFVVNMVALSSQQNILQNGHYISLFIVYTNEALFFNTDSMEPIDGVFAMKVR